METFFYRELLSNIHCTVDLSEYPHDVQHCEVPFSSFTHTISEVIFTGGVSCGVIEPCDRMSVVQFPAFKMVSVSSSFTTKQWPNYKFPRLSVNIIFKRQLPFCLYHVRYSNGFDFNFELLTNK